MVEIVIMDDMKLQMYRKKNRSSCATALLERKFAALSSLHVYLSIYLSTFLYLSLYIYLSLSASTVDSTVQRAAQQVND